MHPGDPEAEVAKDVESALAQTVVGIVHNDGPRWRDWTAEDSCGTRRNVAIGRRRILLREAMQGVDLVVLGG